MKRAVKRYKYILEKENSWVSGNWASRVAKLKYDSCRTNGKKKQADLSPRTTERNRGFLSGHTKPDGLNSLTADTGEGRDKASSADTGLKKSLHMTRETPIPFFSLGYQKQGIPPLCPHNSWQENEWKISLLETDQPKRNPHIQNFLLFFQFLIVECKWTAKDHWKFESQFLAERKTKTNTLKEEIWKSR